LAWSGLAGVPGLVASPARASGGYARERGERGERGEREARRGREPAHRRPLGRKSSSVVKRRRDRRLGPHGRARHGPAGRFEHGHVDLDAEGLALGDLDAARDRAPLGGRTSMVWGPGLTSTLSSEPRPRSTPSTKISASFEPLTLISSLPGSGSAAAAGATGAGAGFGGSAGAGAAAVTGARAGGASRSVSRSTIVQAANALPATTASPPAILSRGGAAALAARSTAGSIAAWDRRGSGARRRAPAASPDPSRACA
jgi:hypothetical protein